MSTPSQTLAEDVATSLAAHGTDRIFGVPGGGSNLDVIQACADWDIEFVLMHGETAACIAASTYGLVTGQVGVALVTRGPGLASAVNGLAHATKDQQPLLLLSDLVTSASSARVRHQSIDQQAMAAPVSRWTATAGEGDAQATLSAALACAAGPPMGGVHVELDPTAPSDPPHAPAPVGQPDPEAVAHARRLIESSRRPIVVVGVGARGSASAVHDSLLELGWPLLTTYQAKGTVPEDHANAAGVFTNGALSRPLMDQADLVLLIGVGEAEEFPNAPWTHDQPVVAVDALPVDNPYLSVDASVAGALPDALRQLLGELDGRDWDTGTGQAHRLTSIDRLAAVGDQGHGLTPQATLLDVQSRATDRTVVTVDSGVHLLVAMGMWTGRRPHDVLISRGLATMGYALPAALGAALADPEADVVAIVGDGGLGMVLGELETLERTNAKVTVVVFNDDQLTMIRLKQAAGGGGGPSAVAYHAIDFAAVAAGMGMPGTVVATRRQLQAALDAWGRGPRLIDAKIDAEPYHDVMQITRG